MKKSFVFLGCGGIALEIAEYVNDINLKHGNGENVIHVTDIVDPVDARFDDVAEILNKPVQQHREISDVNGLADKLVLICLGDAVVRHERYVALKQMGCQFGTIIHPTAWIASTAKIGEGTIVCPFAFVGAKANVAENCLLNVRATIAHDVNLAQSVVISPHADINGGSSCGEAVFIGAGTIVDPMVSLGAYSKVASASVVKTSVDKGFLLTGNPAKGRRMFKVPAH